jgi:arylsulfatase
MHPEDRTTTPYEEWTFSGSTIRMPEFTAPKLGNTANIVTIDADVPANANGVLSVPLSKLLVGKSGSG